MLSSSPSSAQLPSLGTPDVPAAILSYLIPGLGQIYQKRYGKGVLFLVCLYGLFFYGMFLGNWKNVYVLTSEHTTPSGGRGGFMQYIFEKSSYYGQFWIGVAAWPALMHYYDIPMPFSGLSESWRDFQRVPDEAELNVLQANGDKTWDLGWAYTVIAGVLNILVIYDAFAGPTFLVAEQTTPARNRMVTRESPQEVPAT
ncbi:MAG: DUF6677 family protein [Gemmataceae bacterium]